jgi:hypothetical protein
MKTMKTMGLLVVTFLALSCVTFKNKKKARSLTSDDDKKILLHAFIGERAKVSDACTIVSVAVVGNTLELEVSYGGGCKEHSFQLIGSAALAKSMPPVRSVQLVHAADKDECKKMMQQKLYIDISALAYKQEHGSEVYLTIEGWSERIKYSFD